MVGSILSIQLILQQSLGHLSKRNLIILLSAETTQTWPIWVDSLRLRVTARPLREAALLLMPLQTILPIWSKRINYVRLSKRKEKFKEKYNQRYQQLISMWVSTVAEDQRSTKPTKANNLKNLLSLKTNKLK